MITVLAFADSVGPVVAQLIRQYIVKKAKAAANQYIEKIGSLVGELIAGKLRSWADGVDPSSATAAVFSSKAAAIAQQLILAHRPSLGPYLTEWTSRARTTPEARKVREYLSSSSSTIGPWSLRR